MNGYEEAMKADPDTIKALKEDQGKLIKYAQVPVKGYMKKVSLMNQDGKVAENKKSSSYSDLSL